MDAERTIASTAAIFDVSRADLLGPGRTERIALARQALAWVLRQGGWSFDSIGAVLGGRDHTTIMYSVEKVDRMRAYDPRFAERLDDVMAGAVRPVVAYQEPPCHCACAERLAALEARLARLEARS